MTATAEAPEAIEIPEAATSEAAETPETPSEDNAIVTTTETAEDTTAPSGTPEKKQPQRGRGGRRAFVPPPLPPSAKSTNTGETPTAEEPEPVTATETPAPEEPEPVTATETPAPEQTTATPAAASRADGGFTQALNHHDVNSTEQGREFYIDPQLVAPHPFNAPGRSLPQPGEPKWEELLSTVRIGGNTVAASVVSVEAFLAHRPEFAETLGNVKYVAVYGHRRRAACIEAGRPLKAIRDDAQMKDGGDLDALARENYGREDLSELEDARMLARYGNVSQRKLAKRLGRDQATISRRLALLKTTPEVQQAVEEKKLPAPDAAILGGKLPYTPGEGKPEDRTDERRDEQMRAFELIRTGRRQATSACELVIAMRESHARAASEKVEIVDPREKFGEKYHQQACLSESDVERARKSGTLVASVDEHNGNLRYYTSKKPEKSKPADTESPEKVEAKLRKDAQTARRAACVQLIKKPLPQRELLELLARQYNNGMAQRGGSTAGSQLAGKWWFDAAIDPTFGDDWREQMFTNESPKVDAHAAWARAVAAFELRASETFRAGWDAVDVQFFELLRERANYEPTEWERARLESAREAIASAQDEESPSDDESDDAEAPADSDDDTTPEAEAD